MPINVIRAGLDPTGGADNASKLAGIASEIAGLYAAKKPLPRIVFPEGIYAFSAWPDLAFDNLEIVAEGEVRLIPSSNIIFDASLRSSTVSQPSVGWMRFEGFDIYAPSAGPVPLVFRGIHRSKLSAKVLFLAPPLARSAIQMTFCIITELHPVVGGGNKTVTGVLLDAWPGKPDLQSTASTIWNPILEGCGIGLDMQSAGSCAVYNGTIEGNSVGVHLGAAAGNNMFYSVEMEGNGQDVKADSGAHKNGFLYCGNSSKLNTNFGLFDSNWAQH